MLPLEAERRCCYRRPDGRQCGAPAMLDHRYCELHRAWWGAQLHELCGLASSRSDDEPGDDVMESAFTELVRLMLTNQIDDARAGVLLYALQTASDAPGELWYCD